MLTFTAVVRCLNAATPTTYLLPAVVRCLSVATPTTYFISHCE